LSVEDFLRIAVPPTDDPRSEDELLIRLDGECARSRRQRRRRPRRLERPSSRTSPGCGCAQSASAGCRTGSVIRGGPAPTAAHAECAVSAVTDRTPFSTGGGWSGGFVRDDRCGGVIRPVYRPASQRASHGHAHPLTQGLPTLWHAPLLGHQDTTRSGRLGSLWRSEN
jgi:hypothetical protein